MSEFSSDRRSFLAAAAAGAALSAYGAAATARAAEDVGAEPLQATLDVRDFGAKLDGVSDDTEAVQAAIDAAQDRLIYIGERLAQVSIPTVTFPPGDCLVTRTLYWKSCSLVGLDPALSTRILWGGLDNGGPVLYRPSGYPGDGWVHRLEGISFQCAAPAAQPRTWLFLDLLVDKFSLLRRVHFADCRGDAIVITRGWVNLHWEHLRWDNIGGFAIRAIVPRAQHLVSFTLRNFTYDHSAAERPGEGFLLIDNSVNETNIGTVSLSGARIEINRPWRGKQALIAYRLPRSPNGKTCGFFLSDIDYQDGAGMADDCLLYIDSEGMGLECLMIQNCRVGGLGKVLGGNWTAGHYLPPVPHGGAFALTTIFAGNFEIAGDELKLRGPDNERPYLALSLAREGDSAPRLASDYDGRLTWGPGRADADTALYRAGKAVLKSDGRLIAAAGFGVGNAERASRPGTVVGRVQLFDEKGEPLGFLPLYDRID